MSHVRESSTHTTRPLPDEALLAEPQGHGRAPALLRTFFARPLGAARLVHLLLALGGIGLAATSFVFLFVSEHRPLFGFREYGYRTGIVIALTAEATAVVALTTYLAMRARGKT